MQRQARLITDPPPFFSSCLNFGRGGTRLFLYRAWHLSIRQTFVLLCHIGYQSVFNIKTLNWGGARRQGFGSLQRCAVGEIRSVAGVGQRARTSSPACNLCFLPQPSSRPETHRHTDTQHVVTHRLPRHKALPQFCVMATDSNKWRNISGKKCFYNGIKLTPGTLHHKSRMSLHLNPHWSWCFFFFLFF